MSASAMEQSVIERREDPRVDLEGRFSVRLDLGDGREPLTCAVLDYSVTGLRLSVPADVKLPDNLQVVIGKLSHNARLVWRKDDIAGLDLIDEHHDLY